MDIYIECPVCELQFSTPAVSPGQPIVCPSCSRSFPRSSAVEISAPATHRDVRPYSARLTVPPAFESPTTPLHDPIPTAESAREPAAVAKKPILALQRKRRDRRRLITTLISSAVLAAIIGVLGGLLVQRLKENPIVSGGAPETQWANPDSNLSSEMAPATMNRTDSENSTITMNPERETVETDVPITAAEIPPQTFTYQGNQKKAESLWNAVRPQLVGLKIHNGLGTHDAVGTIVDSRGWVLTSYSAVKGASKIEVKASVQTIDDVWKTEPLTDLVRGYVAANQENDLILLSINRRFVVAFSMVQPVTRNNVVQGQYLFQCAPPSRQNVYGVTEAKIIQRSEFDGLDSTGQALIRRKQLDSDEIVWLVATNSTAPSPGTPIFKTDGKLAAINVFDSDTDNYFVPVDQLDSLIANSEDDVKPISQLSGTGEDGGPIAVAPNHSMHQSSVRLNQLAEACEGFGWVPQSRQNYETLQEFAKAYWVIKQYVDDNADRTVADEQKIIAQVVQLQMQLASRAASLTPEDELQLVQMNKQFAAQELSEATRCVPFYGEVHYVDIVNAQLILKLIGTESYAKAPFVPTDDPMRMQTKWLFFANTPAVTRRMNYRISADELVTAESIDELLNFGEQ